MSSITKLLSENIVMSPPNNNKKNTIYRESVFPSFISALIDTIDDNNDNKEGKNKSEVKGGKHSFEFLTSHLLSGNLRVHNSGTNLYMDVLASSEIFDTCQNQRASVEVCKTATLNKPFGEPPNKPHDWPPFIFKNNRQSDVFHKRYFENRDLNFNFDSLQRLQEQEENEGDHRSDIDVNNHEVASVDVPIKIYIENDTDTDTDTEKDNDTIADTDTTICDNTDADAENNNQTSSTSPVFDTKLDHVMETLLSIKIDRTNNPT